MEKRNYFPRIWHTIIILCACAGIQLVGGLAIGILGTHSASTEELVNWVVLVSSLSIFLIAAFCMIRYKMSIKRMFAFVPRNALKVIWVALIVAGAYFLRSVLGNFLSRYIHEADTMPQLFDGLLTGWLGVVDLVILAPVFEEVLFRGIILRGFLKNYSVKTAVIMSSLFFGIIHLNIVQGFLATLLGLIIAIIFVKTGSLWLCIAAHAFNNLLSVLEYNAGGIPGDIGNYITFPVLLFAASALAAGGLFMIIRGDSRVYALLEEEKAEEDLRKPAETEFLQYYPGTQIPVPMRHSGLGIASFAISLSVGLVWIIVIIVYTAQAASLETMYGESMANFTIVSLIMAIWFIISALVNISGLCLGVGGTGQSFRRKTFAILGIVLNSLSLFFMVLILLIGIVVTSVGFAG
jgi:membrane protease YdiL (CAAX protease family)